MPDPGTSVAEVPVSPSEGTASAEPSEGSLHRELRTVEQDVNTVKERVFRSKATLQLLRELVLEGDTVGSRVVIFHENRMGPAYTLESIEYFLDGKSVLSRVDPEGSLDEEREILVLEQALPPGNHKVEVSFVLRGNGLGVFSYLTTYSFKVQSSYSFRVDEDHKTIVRVVAEERGGLLRTFVERPFVKYEETTEGKEDPE